MPPFNLKKSLSLFIVLALPVPVLTLAPAPGLAATKAKGMAKSKAVYGPNTSSASQQKTPGTTNFAGDQDPGFNIEGTRENLEGRLNVAWRPNSTGPSKMVEIHFVLWPDGKYSDVSVWRTSGDKNYDQAAKSCIDQGSFGPYEGPQFLECVATFKSEEKGADVVVRFPAYQGTSSKVDREIAAKKAQDKTNIAIMKQRIATAQKVLGPDSPKLSESINFLANLYATVEDYQSAEATFKWAISIREKANGPNSRELCESLSDMGEMYRHKGDAVSAEECFKKCVNMTGLKPCVQLREAIHRYAKLCMYNKRKADADFLFQRVNDLQAGKPLAPLPANMTLDGVAQSPAAPATSGDAGGGDKSADAAKPDASKSGTLKPEAPKSDIRKPEASKSESTGPDSTRPEAAKSDTAKTDAKADANH